MIRIVCLNTKEIFDSAEVAGKYAGVDRSTINRVSREDTYKIGAGAHPVTEEKLYWLREYLYVPNESYDDLPKTKRRRGFKTKQAARQEAIICINNGQRFETLDQAADFASVRPRTIVDRSLENTFHIGAGFNESVEGKLYWIRERIYNPERNYMSEIKGMAKSDNPKTRKAQRNGAVVCLNTKEVFETIDVAAKWSGLKVKTITQNSTLTRYQLGGGKHPETGEKLYWLRKELYDPEKDYELDSVTKPGLETEMNKEIICLNTLEVFPNFNEAAKWANVNPVSLLNVSGKKTYTTGRGYHPDTRERLYWLRYSLYDKNVEYKIEKVLLTERDAVAKDQMKIVCLNNGKVFENPTEAADWAGVKRSEIVNKSKFESMGATTGYNEQMQQNLYWLRESCYDKNVDYIKEYQLNVRNRTNGFEDNDKTAFLNDLKGLEEVTEWAGL